VTTAASRTIDPWSPYDGRSDLASAGRLSLINAFTAVVRFRLGIEPHELSSIFAAPSDDADNDCMKDLVGLQSRYFVDGFLSGSITSFARPIGGGEAVRMTPTMWELDDCLPRFATGTFNMEYWTDSDAKPTHHIFVDNEHFEKLLMSLPTDDYLSEYQLQCIADPRFALMHRQQNERSVSSQPSDSDSAAEPTRAPDPQDRLIRLGSVIERCGIQKSKIYELIKIDQFPKQASVGGKSLWSEREIDQWVEQRKTDRS
tara:strand:- start:558 stop:1331 length:774 start_codon:yes stop_codon:yes gene_type:complete